MTYLRIVLILMFVITWFGCVGTSKPVRKVTKSVDDTAAELVKIREIKTSEGETRAVVSPADEKKLKITF